MTDVRLSPAFFAHPKTKKLERRVGADGVLCFLRLWTFAASNKRGDGDLSGLDDEDIELAAEWGGEEGKLVEALVSVGYLDGDAEARQIHDFAEHQPWAAGAKKRSETARRNAAKRWGNAEKKEEQCQSMPVACEQHADGMPPLEIGNAPSPSPSPSPNTPPEPAADPLDGLTFEQVSSGRADRATKAARKSSKHLRALFADEHAKLFARPRLDPEAKKHRGSLQALLSEHPPSDVARALGAFARATQRWPERIRWRDWKYLRNDFDRWLEDAQGAQAVFPQSHTPPAMTDAELEELRQLQEGL